MRLTYFTSTPMSTLLKSIQKKKIKKKSRARWADIPVDIATKIAEHIQVHEDLESFSRVCFVWRIAAKQARFQSAYLTDDDDTKSRYYLPCDHRRHQVPWLILPDHEHRYCCQERSYHSLCIPHKSYTVNFPNLTFSNSYCLLSSRGWLLCLDTNDCPTLFTPLSGSCIQLPSFSRRRICFNKFVLSCSNPRSRESNYGAVVIYSDPRSVSLHYRVAMWWKGDRAWTLFNLKDDVGIIPFCHDVVFYNGRIYAVYANSQVYCLGLRCNVKKQLVGSIPINLQTGTDPSMLYLVESEGGKLLVIYRCIRALKDGHDDIGLDVKPDEVKTLEFRAFEVNVETQEAAKEVFSLGDRAVFLGLNSSFSIKADPNHGTKPNCIYYTDHYMSMVQPILADHKVRDMGIYHLSSKTFEPYEDHLLAPYSGLAAPPMWVQHHLIIKGKTRWFRLV